MKKIFSFVGVNPDVQINYNESYNESTLPRNKVIGDLYKNKKIRETITGLIPKALKKQFKKAALTNKTLPAITEEERSFLKDIFNNDISHLSKLIGRDLNSWQ
jgi:ribonucleotide reductase beta subunit family protein with ferritin-like domain